LDRKKGGDLLRGKGCCCRSRKRRAQRKGKKKDTEKGWEEERTMGGNVFLLRASAGRGKEGGDMPWGGEKVRVKRVFPDEKGPSL